MQARVTRQIASDWVKEWTATPRSSELNCCGAYLSGSILEALAADPERDLAVGSDVDIVLVLDVEKAPPKPGKFLYRGALLEASFLEWRSLADPEAVLGEYHLAHPFREAPWTAILYDPQGRLHRVKDAVAPCFAQPEWVLRRCQQVRTRIEQGLQTVDVNAPLHGRMMYSLFDNGGVAHLFLVAALCNPTVRRRYSTVRAALAEHGYAALHEELLTLLGSASVSPKQAHTLLQELATTFDLAAPIGGRHDIKHLSYATDISTAARTIAIDGSHAMIDAGDHREAMFWIAVTFTRCHHILAHFLPGVEEARRPALEEVAQLMGIATAEQISARAQQTLKRLPDYWQVAEHIVKAGDR